MKKFLVVGCGGSGAKTLAFMMDQLKAELRSIDPDMTELPKAWQFVNIDVPLEEEAGPQKLPNVTQNGGQYVGIGSRQNYNTFDEGVSSILGRSGKLGEIATWATRNPASNDVKLADGAGQYRAIGRMLTLPHLKEIRQSLKAAVDEMFTQEAIQELNRLNYKQTKLDSDTGDSQPVVLVVSSMAGGAGASMFLDVCRVLTTIPNVNPQGTLVFMYTPEIFSDNKADDMAGAWPNSLAMFGEVVAAQMGNSSKHDRAIFEAFDMGNPPEGQTFGRIFPIGSKMGTTSARFGDGSAMSIYRGLGRALAGLMASTKASDNLVSYALTNTPAGDGGRRFFGWDSPTGGTPWGRLPWGSLGYAQVSMGRDRFAEYSSQRLARSAFERLFNGHLDPQNPEAGEMQIAKKLEERLPNAFSSITLDPSWAHGGQIDSGSVWNWLNSVFGGQAQQAADSATKYLQNYIPVGQGRNVNEWRDEFEGNMADPRNEQAIASVLNNAAYDIVYRYANFFTDSVLATVEGELAAVGVPYVREMLSKITDVLTNSDRLMPVLGEYSGYYQNTRVLTKPEGADPILSPLTGKGQMTDPTPTVNALMGLYYNQFYSYALMAIAHLLKDVLQDYADENLFHLKRELADAHAVLEKAVSKRAETNKLADVRTDEVNAWPTEIDEVVETRFKGAENEIMLTDVNSFIVDYKDQMLRTIQGQQSTADVTNYEQAYPFAVRSVIRGEWESLDAAQAPNDTLAPQKHTNDAYSNRAGWVSKYLSRHPQTGESRESQRAHYHAKIRPTDLLERSRQWINRRDYEFQKFNSVDLRRYLTLTPDINEVEHAERQRRFVEAFQLALSYARPLAAVNDDMVQRIHGKSVQYTYSFSDIPFAELGSAESGIAAQLESVLNRPEIDGPSSVALRNSLNMSDHVQHIEIFGSYPNYSPIVFSSMFNYIAKDIEKQDNFDGSWWSERRTRPLPAALPLTETERQAMVAGWIIGRITGRVYISNPDASNAAAHIFDDTDGGVNNWVDFPNPMLISPRRMIKKSDWMSSVLESIFIAYAKVQENGPHGFASSLYPYQLLRGLFDDGLDFAHSGASTHPVVHRLAQFLASGEVPNRGTVGTSIQDRYETFVAELDKFARGADHFVPGHTNALPGQGRANKPFAEIRSREVASMTPYYRDLAEDVIAMVPVIRNYLDQAKTVAENPVAQPSPQARTSESDFGQTTSPEFNLNDLDDTF
ncbi:tubulin-like doman-containing protein [Corynebacterium sp. MSK218]|uniref:tubulin-like doman-containing protein n=1 Tax=Corynebacterium sp. MSK218 TaxID=3050218 RepID=UPI00254E4550|nr:tubulin-like doman-containing protein [Corynebacterium sp. MSK218]MDK8764470.1 tubulin-like doman-containing protein [Corynebacterium sp. MSK218]